MGLNGLTPYEKLKELQGVKISEDFEVSKILTLVLALDTSYVFGTIKNEEFCSHPI
jgi:hypothetical protein